MSVAGSCSGRGHWLSQRKDSATVTDRRYILNGGGHRPPLQVVFSSFALIWLAVAIYAADAWRANESASQIEDCGSKVEDCAPQSTIHNPQSTIHNPPSTIHNPDRKSVV